MPQTDREDRLSLIALALVFTVLVIVSGLGLMSRVQAGHLPTQGAITALYDPAQMGPSEGHWLPEFSARDTYAQWAMTAMAFVALIVSVAGVVLVRMTFVETRTTAQAAVASNETARRLGEAQVRAYVSWDGAERNVARSTENNELVGFILVPVIRNTGQSPAYIRMLYTYLSLVDLDAPPPLVTFSREGAEVDHELGAGNAFNMSDRMITADEARAINLRQKRCFLMGYGEYRDVFWQSERDTRSFRFSFEVTLQTPPHHEMAVGGLQLHNNASATIEPAN